MGGLPDNAGMLWAVAELISVGLEGGALRFNPNPGSTRGITTSFFLEFPDPFMTNWKLRIPYIYLRSAELGKELQNVVHLALRERCRGRSAHLLAGPRHRSRSDFPNCPIQDDAAWS